MAMAPIVRPAPQAPDRSSALLFQSLLSATLDELRDAGLVHDGTKMNETQRLESLTDTAPFPLALISGDQWLQRYTYALSLLYQWHGQVETKFGVLKMKPLIIKNLAHWKLVESDICHHCVILLEISLEENSESDREEAFNQCVHAISSVRSVMDRENWVIVSMSTFTENEIRKRRQDDIFYVMHRFTFYRDRLFKYEPRVNFRFASAFQKDLLLQYFRPADDTGNRQQTLDMRSLLNRISGGFDQVDEFLRTPVRYAFMKGDLELVKNMLRVTYSDTLFHIFLDTFWAISDKNLKLDEILEKAVSTLQYPQILSAFLHNGANPYSRNISGLNLLQVLSLKETGMRKFDQVVKTVNILLNHNLSVEIRDFNYRNLLHLAGADGNEPLVKLLASTFPHLVLSEDAMHRSPLLQAVDYGVPELAADMIACANVSVHQRWNPRKLRHHLTNALHGAVFNSNARQVDFLLKHGADWRIVTEGNQENLLHRACVGGDPDILRRLLPTLSSMVNKHTVDRQTPLTLAINNPADVSLCLVKLLLEHGANTNCAFVRTSALHLASRHGHSEVVALLLQRGANLEARDSIGDTPLHKAAKRGHSEVVRLLLNGGALTEVFNMNGQTPVELAELGQHECVVSTLKHFQLAQEDRSFFGVRAC